MKSVIALVILLSSSFSFAQSFVSFECKVENPCQYSRTGLGYCVGDTSLSINDRSASPRSYSHLVVGKMGGAREVFEIAADIPVTFTNAGKTVIGSTEDGEDHTTMRLAADGKTAYGQVTLEQDFQFALVCKLR